MTTDINAEERARRAQEAKLKAEITRRMAEEAAREAEEAEREAAGSSETSNAGDAPETPEKPAEARTGGKSASAKPSAEDADTGTPVDTDAADETDADAELAKPAKQGKNAKAVTKADAASDTKADATSDDADATSDDGDTPDADDEAGDVKLAKAAETDADVAEVAEDDVDTADAGADVGGDSEESETPSGEDGSGDEGDEAAGRKKRRRGRQAKIVTVEDGTAVDAAPRRERGPGAGALIFLSTVSMAVWLLIAVNILLVGGLSWLLIAKSGQSGGSDKETKAVQFAATRAAEDISSYDYRTIDSDLKRAAGHTTGNFKTQFDQQISQVKTSAQQQQAVVEGQAVKTAVENVDGDKAIALVYLDQTTAKQASASRTPNQYTLRMVMKKVKGQWMVSDLQML
ncbi:hypothetical protein [Actinomadura rupiterrae]|uniref:hypothetical protein n=1 Tax=Actinomadura rupiterrae TaxID=559627 RepID=UPI0020A5A011|nr:hypothetical protein [Actinomadura rupiterrae]MCP2343342.1 Mce-associated membrane protein [Actinomadura rupiterrae]